MMEEKKELGMGWYKFLKNWTFGIGIVISFFLSFVAFFSDIETIAEMKMSDKIIYIVIALLILAFDVTIKVVIHTHLENLSKHVNRCLIVFIIYDLLCCFFFDGLPTFSVILFFSIFYFKKRKHIFVNDCTFWGDIKDKAKSSDFVVEKAEKRESVVDTDNDFEHIIGEEKSVYQQTIIKKKNPINIILLVILIIFMVVFCFLIVQLNNLNIEKNRIEQELIETKTKYSKLEEESKLPLLAFYYLSQEIKWGYATENFHAETGIIIVDDYSNETINITMNYQNTTCYVESSNISIVDPIFLKENWNYGEKMEVSIIPQKEGIAILTFSNDTYDSTFKVLVIVK